MGKRLLGKVTSRLCIYPVGQKFSQNRSYISLHFRDKRIFAFNAEIQDVRQKWWKNEFWKKSPVDSAVTLCIKHFVEIALSLSVSEINAFLCLTQKFKMTTKSGGKTIFAKSHQYTLQITCGSKISSKLLYLAPFLR